MSFTTYLFFGFFAFILLLYYVLPQRLRKLLLLAASYVFYMWSMPALGAVLLASTAISYAAARWMSGRERGSAQRVCILAGACVLHFGLLFVCKYLQMALDLAFRFGLFGPVQTKLLLPVGISFFTFAVTGYLFDVYREKMPAETNFLDYAVFVSFFPCVLAGPINRAREFLPQLKHPIRFSGAQVKHGILRFVFGLLQKLVLADNIGTLVNAAYGGAEISPLTWIAVLLLYSLQIYFDFSGYSHMAIGVAEAFGLVVPENFNAPYLSTSVTSFWRKWHISLTSWFREYLYFPLGGSRKGSVRTCVNILIVFAVSGLWHGAAVHYVLWGLLNGVLQVLERLIASPRKKLERRLQGWVPRALCALLCGVITYCLISLTWLLFRADGMSQLRYVVGQILGMFRTGLGGLQLARLGLRPVRGWVLLSGCCLCTAVDALWARGWRMRRLSDSVLPYYAVIALLIVAVAAFGVYGNGFDPQDFVYFRY